MKRLRLINLRLRNFKGIEKLDLNADGQNIEIKGANGTGKTTIFDAFIYLLFGKDSQNKTDFEIKPLNENGEVKKHGLDHEVEGLFLLDGQELNLKRIYSEKWTKKRGSARSFLTGHTTTYYINGVPSKKKEYEEKINEIVSEDVFKLLTNPLYFNEQLHWKKRRELLIEIAGDVTNEEIAKGDKQLEEFIVTLNGKDIDDYLKIIHAKQKEINKELEEIPSRIDENSLAKPNITGLDRTGLENELKRIDQAIQENKDKINDFKNGSGTRQKENQLKEIQLEITQLKHEYEEKYYKGIHSIQKQITDLTGQIYDFKAKITPNELKIDFNNKQINRLLEEVQEKREQWIAENKKEFDHENNCYCPTCNQDLPQEKIEESISNFNKAKATTLEKIQKEAEKKKEEQAFLERDNKSLQDEILQWYTNIEDLQTELNKREKEKEELEKNKTNLEKDSYYIDLKRQYNELVKEIENYQDNVTDSIQNIELEIQELNKKRSNVQQELDKFNQLAYYEQREAQLHERERELSQEYEKLEQSIYLAETFTKRKIEQLEKKINSKFKMAKFIMYTKQVNGGINPTCDTTYNGIPYSRGLNNAMRINIGIDILNTLQKHYGVYLPLFVDNRESVIDLINTDTQVISLIVAETENLNIKKLA